MAELFMDKRASFPNGKQKKFIEKIHAKFTIAEMATLCRCSQRTIRDWRREKFSMDYSALQMLSQKAKIPLPRNIRIKEKYWYVSKGARLGWKEILKKYGGMPINEEYRKKKWFEWWEKKGKHKIHPIINVCKPVRKPGYSKNLAEFVGIVLGDGCISQRQITISLHRQDDKEYSAYIVSLIKNLFGVPVGIYHSKKDLVADFTISRSELVRYCVKKLGLHQGNKVRQQVDIPKWIKRNKKYLVACIRGLIDTDGSLYSHRYQVKGKLYTYKKLSFSNSSRPLLVSVFHALKILGMNPHETSDGKNVRLENKHDIHRYFLIVGSHNSKILNRYTI